ncbi:MAG: 50S ribosomal protein L23 [Planctomycetota bacterium]
MKNSHSIVLAPLITEKSTHATERQHSYYFRVRGDANKIEIKRAIEEIFDVKVQSVNTLWQRGKHKRMGRSQGMTSSYKKAIIRLVPGHKIEIV